MLNRAGDSIYSRMAVSFEVVFSHLGRAAGVRAAIRLPRIFAVTAQMPRPITWTGRGYRFTSPILWIVYRCWSILIEKIRRGFTTWTFFGKSIRNPFSVNIGQVCKFGQRRQHQSEVPRSIWGPKTPKTGTSTARSGFWISQSTASYPRLLIRLVEAYTYATVRKKFSAKLVVFIHSSFRAKCRSCCFTYFPLFSYIITFGP